MDELRRLKASDGPALHIWGSSELLQTLIAADLVDEYRLWVFPVVLGEGKRLFENGVPPRGLTLVETGSTPSGVLFNTYRPAGPVKIDPWPWINHRKRNRPGARNSANGNLRVTRIDRQRTGQPERSVKSQCLTSLIGRCALTI